MVASRDPSGSDTTLDDGAAISFNRYGSGTACSAERACTLQPAPAFARRVLALAGPAHRRVVPAAGVAHDEVGQRRDVRGSVVECRDVVQAAAAGLAEELVVLQRDLLQRLQAVGGEAGAQHVHAPHARGAPFLEQLVGVGLEPGLAADARLEADEALVRAQIQPLGEQAGGLVALAVVGIAGREVALRNAVEGEQQPLAAAVSLPVLAHALGERVQVAVVVVVVADKAQVRQPAHAPELVGEGVEHRGHRGRRVLRVHGQHQQPAHPPRAQLVQRGGDGRRAVAHAQRDREHAARRTPFQLPGERVALAEGDAQQRRALLTPHRRVGRRGALRPQPQDDAVQHQPPGELRHLDDARVAEELAQVATDRRRRRLVRCTQVGDQHADALGRVVRVAALSLELLGCHRGVLVGRGRNARV